MKRKSSNPEYKKLLGSAPAVVSKDFLLWVAENNAKQTRYSVIIKKNT